MPFARFFLNQFDVEHHRSTMKIGTDALLLGAWCPVFAGIRNVLDIGCGCGIIGLMLAQRVPKARIHGIDLHLPSIEEAEGNAERSGWGARCQFFHQDVRKYYPSATYDLVISNPPFFEGQRPQQEPKQAARHQMSLSTGQMLEAVSRLLSKDGCFATILPSTLENRVIEIAARYDLHPMVKTRVSHREGVAPRRTLFAMSRAKTHCVETSLIIGTDGDRTEAYDNLLMPFIGDHKKRPPQR